MPSQKKKDAAPPLGALIVLSLVFPGAGQLALGRRGRGFAYAGVTILLFIVFFYQLSNVVPPLFSALASGAPPAISDDFITGVKALLYIFGAALFVWIAALADTVITAVRARAKNGS